MAKSTIDRPEIETLDYHSPLCKCPDCKKKPAQEDKEKTTPDIEPETENKESVRLCEKCQVPNCGCKAVLLKEPEQPDYSKCRHCGACRVVRPAGEWQFACKCNEDDKIYPPEQPKDNQWELEYGLPEQPNQQLMIVKTIQGLMTCVCNSLYKLDMSVLMPEHYKHYPEHHKMIAKALEEIDLFEKTTLFDLQKEYE